MPPLPPMGLWPPTPTMPVGPSAVGEAADRRSLWRGFVVAVVAVLRRRWCRRCSRWCARAPTPDRWLRRRCCSVAGCRRTSNPSTDALATEVQRVLDRRAAAPAAGDLAGWLTPLDPAATEFVGRQREAFVVLRELDVRTARWTVARVLAQTAAGLSRVEVAGEWTVPGVDPAPAPSSR